jgi:hypothetical protein
MANLTLLEIAQMTGNDDVVGLIEESISAHPEVNESARTIRGTSYKTLIRTALPSTGFRNANEGSSPVISTYENKLVETYISESRIQTDRAVADAHEDGPESVMAMEASGVVESLMRSFASQMYYGTATTVATSTASSPTKGFPGLIETVDSSLVVDKAGTGSATSSIWALKFGPQWLQWVFGNNGSLTMSDTRVETVLDGSSNPYENYVRVLLTYPGFQMVNKYAAGRIKNISVATGVDDDDLATLLSQFPEGVEPDAFYMTKRSQESIRSNRTATNPSGSPAELPDSAFGIPIITTNGIVNTETAA